MRSMRSSGKTLPLALTALLVAACGDSATTPDSGNPGTVADLECSIRFSLTDHTLFSILGTKVNYARASGAFVGLGGDVECTRLTDRATVVTSNWNCDPERRCYGSKPPLLYVQVLSSRNFAGPLDLVDCRFAASDIPEPGDFEIEVINVHDELFQPVVPPPVLAITNVNCHDAGVTTTTTTLPDPCEGVDCGDDAACLDGHCVPSTSYEVTFGVDDDEQFGALQFEVEYDCRDGSFDGVRVETACAVNPSLNVHAAFNNRSCDPQTDTARMSAAFIGGPNPIDGPAIVASCRYTSATGASPDPDHFEIHVSDASSPSYVAIPNVTVSVYGIRAIAP